MHGQHGYSSLPNPDQYLDFAKWDIHTIKNKSVLDKLGTHIPSVWLIHRTHYVPYLHELEYSILSHWLFDMSHRTHIRDVHNPDDLRKIIGKIGVIE